MKNLYVNVSRETRMVDLPKQFIAVDGENLQSKLVFTFIDEFVNGQTRLEYEIKGNKNYVVLDKENNAYTIPVKNVITKEGQIDMQLVITEGTNEEEIPVFKSNKFYLYCNSSINAVEEAPDGYELWIEQANVKLNQIDNLDIEATKENKVTRVVITRKDGSQEITEILDGEKGEKGEKGDAGSIKFIIVNELPTENIDESAIYMKAVESEDAQNTYEEYIYVNGAWESLGTASVEVDLTDYVKNTDYASSSTGGVIKPITVFATEVNGNGNLTAVGRTYEQYKNMVDYAFIGKGTLENVLNGKFVTLTQAEYDALTTKDENTYYYIVEE